LLVFKAEGNASHEKFSRLAHGKGAVEVDESVVGGQEEGVRGRKNGKKQIVVFSIEKKGKGVARVYAKTIKKLLQQS